MKEKLKILIEQAVAGITETDVYALSLFVYDVDDDPMQPTISFGFNTERQFQESLEDTDELEARWNYAFWLQNSLFVFGEGETATDVKEWMKEHKFTELSEDDVDETVTATFVEDIVTVVQELHNEAILTKKFGKELPVLIHELEYYDEIAQQNMKANGTVLPVEFVKFCTAEY